MKIRYEIAKLLIDVAKYMLTALLLSYIFVDLDNPWTFFGLVLMIMFLFFLGIYLIWVENKNK